MDFLQKIFLMTQDNIIYDVGYDVFKIVIGFIFARYIYEKIFMKLRWGGWKIRVQDGSKEHFTRDISPIVAKRIMTDGADFSVFVKGVASTVFWVNQKDMSLENVNNTELLRVNRSKKLIIIDEKHNPVKANQVSNQQILNQLIKLEELISVGNK